ncbi:structural maintenance of chromosome protein [Cavenderia fasciculata]|uniref:Structural maintenance of chromosomes protein n=1 Tax=Cavenderia fasciculata TaxID=261658 RepID=F4PGN9_CACFS|nr:structural maintenance of chromosome protein [Cavenderia fasciculata]EGG24873.1 structural maintenance of chromosome protein [Cavenderia fasciculata]|eukprot:XP_004362724.1 structural maintenance of chromosome protein [Cavenderia fasciculata]
MCSIDSLEVKNFKSYKGTHILGPFLQFSCVIGPNGSGKSNLMDAITFVLGVSSATSTRSNISQLVYSSATTTVDVPTTPKFNDLIAEAQKEQHTPDKGDDDGDHDDDGDDQVGPTKKKKGQLESYVKLKYIDFSKDDDDDGDGSGSGQTVYEFMRKIRGSSTVYYINSKTVDRNDYLDKLSTLGVHSSCSNFCVLQGDVQNIASKDPREITRAVERISGSDQFKAEYDQLYKQKTEIEALSVRTYSRVKELTVDRDHYKTQLAEHKQYFKVVKQRDEIAIKIALLELKFIRSELARFTGMREKAAKEIAQIESERENLANEKKQANKKQATKHKEVMEMEFKLKKLTQKKNKTKPNAFKATEEINFLTERAKKIQDMIAQANKNRSLQQKTLEMLTQQQNEIQEKLEQLDLTQQLDKGLSLTNDQIERYNALKVQAGKTTSEDKKKLDQLLRTQNFEREKQSSQEASIDDWTKMIEQLDNSTKQLEERKKKSEELLVHIEKQIQELTEEIGKTSSRNESQYKRQQTLTKELDQIQFKLSSEKTHRAEKERDKKMNYAISECKKLFPGVKGKLIDLCRPRNKFETAFTVAMGKLADAVVVETELAANMCMSYFKEQMVGVTTFLPLDRLYAKPTNEKLRQLGGDGRTAKLLMDCIEFDSQIDLAVRYAIGNLLVCDTLQEARMMAFSAERHKVITIDGIKITKSGLMSGGLMGVKDRTAKLNAGNVEELKKRRDSILQDLAEIEHTSANFYELDNLKSRLEELKSTAQLHKDTLKPIEERIKKNATEKESKIRLIDSFDKEVDQLKKSTTERQALIDSTQAAIDKEEKGIFADFCKELKIPNIQEFEVNRMEKLQKQTQAKLELSLQLSKVQNQINYEGKKDYNNEVSLLDNDLKSNNQQLEKEIQTQTATQNENEEIQDQITDANDKLKKLKDEVLELNNTIKQLRTISDDKAKAHGELESSIKIYDVAIENGKVEYHKLLAKAKLDNMKLPLLKEDQMEVEEEEEEEKEDSDEEMKDSDEDEDEKKKKKKQPPPTSPKKKKNAAAPTTPKKKKKGSDDDEEDEEDEEEKGNKKKKPSATSPKKSPGKGTKRKVDDVDEEEKEKEKDKGDEEEDEDVKKKRLEEEEEEKKRRLIAGEDEEEEEEAVDEEDDDNDFLDQVQLWDNMIPDDERLEFFNRHLRIRIDFSSISKLKVKNTNELEDIIKDLAQEDKRLKITMDTNPPNPKAMENLKKATDALREASSQHKDQIKRGKEIVTQFNRIKTDRTELFQKAFDTIKTEIDAIYGELTRDLYPPYLRGSASLSLDDTETPFNSGIKYSAIPPNKRSRDMDDLSGGEKSIAALAFLFAMHKYRPSPFFILDEVDAALDSINVLKLVRYIREKSSVTSQLQFIVISLKELFYSNSDGLVGICRNIADSSSISLTVRLDHLPVKTVELLPIKDKNKIDSRIMSARKQAMSSASETSDTGGDATSTSVSE